MACRVPSERIGKNKIEFFVRIGIQITTAVIDNILNARVIENMAAKFDILTQQVIEAFHKLHDYNFLGALYTLEKTRRDPSTHANHKDSLRLTGSCTD